MSTKRIKLRKDITVQALSGTQPLHIKKEIKESLLMNDARLCSIKLSSNRPNMAYAAHPIVGKLTDFRNLDFLVPCPYPDGYFLPKVLVFHEDVGGLPVVFLWTVFAGKLTRALPVRRRKIQASDV